MMKCDVLGTKFTRRYLLLQGSSLWVSKQTTLLDDKSYKQHLTGREEYLMVCMCCFKKNIALSLDSDMRYHCRFVWALVAPFTVHPFRQTNRPPPPSSCT